LANVEGITVTDQGVEQCGIVTFTVEQIKPLPLKLLLAKHQINVSVSSGSGNLVSFQQRGLSEVVRASVHYYNTMAEVDTFVDTLQQLIKSPNLASLIQETAGQQKK